MRNRIDGTLDDMERGKIDRRTAVKRLMALVASAAGAGALASEGDSKGTFEATGLNHLALAVTDVGRSREFYARHLGLSTIRDDGNRCFLRCGDNFVALFPAGEPGMDHYCYTVKDYDPDGAVERLKSGGLSHVRRENRVYFEDPDGLTVQLSGRWSAWPGPAPR